MEQNGGLFMDLQDTPFFKQRVEELEGSAKKLRERCSGLLGSARKYRDALESMQEAQTAFGAALADFGGGTDEDSLLLGSAVMSQFIKTFKELAEFYRHLSTQLSAQLIDRLQQDWVEGALAALREDHKRYEKRCNDHENARIKHLALRKLAKRDVVERSFGDLAAARHGADEARYDLGRRLTEVETSKRHAFLEMVVGTVFAHTKFFEQGHLSLGRLNGATNDALAIVEHLRKEQVARLASLEETIRTHKETAASRDALIAQEVAAAAEGNSGSTCLSAAVSNGAAGGPGGGAAAALPLGVSLGGPVQMSSHHAALSAEVERLLQLTQHSNSQQVTIIKQGYLAKKSQGSKRGDWKRRFFVLDSTGMMYYYSHKSENLMQIGRGLSRPKNTLPLLTSTVKLEGDDPAMRFCFRVVSPEGTYTLQAESDYERSEWITALQAVISCLLNSSLDVATMPRIPIKPTHSRHNSEGDIWGTASGRPSASGSSSMASPMAGGGPGGGSGPGGLPPIDGSDKDYDTSSSREGSFSSGPTSSPPTYPGFRGSMGNPGPSPLSRADGPSPTAAMAAANSSSLQQSGGPGGTAASGPAAAARALAAAAGSHSFILESLRKIPGNLVCADCGAPDPDWASVNLGVLLCIECSGIHRQLGVHISKVRSCTLDVKVWDGVTMDVFEGLGNTRSNRVWEAKLTPAAGGRRSTGNSAAAAAAAGGGGAPGGGGGDTWVLCGAEDVEVEGTSSSGRGSGAAAAAGGGGRSSTSSTAPQPSTSRSSSGNSSRPAGSSRSPAAAPIDEADPHKPLPTDNLAVKQRYVLDKYAGRLWVVALPAAQSQAGLWEAVQTHDLGRALQMIASGADANQAYRTPRAQKLVRDTHLASLRGDPAAAAAAAAEEDGSPGACGDITVLHAAAAEGWAPMLEFLLQNGAQWQHKDAHGRTPLHYALLHNAPATAKQLLRRGAEVAGMKDGRGNTALDLVMARGRVSDEELFVLLSGS